MKILSFFIFFISLLYFYWPRSDERVEIDSVKVKVSSLIRQKKASRNKSQRPSPPPSQHFNKQTETSKRETISPKRRSLAVVNEFKFDEPSSDNGQMKWIDRLKETLVHLEPQFGEEIFDAYSKEKTAFQIELDAMIRERQNSPDLELFIEELELTHEENVRDILGVYYEELKLQEVSFNAE